MTKHYQYPLSCFTNQGQIRDKSQTNQGQIVRDKLQISNKLEPNQRQTTNQGKIRDKLQIRDRLQITNKSGTKKQTTNQ